MQTTITRLGSALAVVLVAGFLSACQEKEGPAEEFGKKVDNAAEDAGEAIEEAGEDMQEKY